MSNLAFNINERGKNEKAKALRKNGEIPCIIYGDGLKESLPIKINKNHLGAGSWKVIYNLVGFLVFLR